MLTKRYPYVDSPIPMVLAHRGTNVYAPENTMEAFGAAVQAGADSLETDVHWTKDGVIVLSHDESVDRCSNGHGLICELTLAELKQLDFGYRFTTDGGETYPFRNCGVQIPTLKELLTAFPDLRINIDIKPKRPVSLAKFIQEVYEREAENRVLVASFHHGVLVEFRAMNVRIATSASPLEVAALLLQMRLGLKIRSPLPYAAWQVPVAQRGVRIVTESTVRKAHDAGFCVHVWTEDDASEMKRLFRLGVDGIVTNDPFVGVETRNAWIQNPSS